MDGHAVNDGDVAAGRLDDNGGENVAVGGDVEARRKGSAEGVVAGDVQGGAVLIRGREGMHGGRKVSVEVWG